MEPSAAPKPSRPRWIGCGLALSAFLGIAAALIFCTPLGYTLMIPIGQRWCEYRNRGEFERRRDRYEAIVVTIAVAGIAPGKSKTYHVSESKDPSTLREVDLEKEPLLFLRHYETQIIVASVQPDGRLVVKSCTYSMGHAGVYGLVYSSGPPEPWEIENSFGIDGRAVQVAPHWWRVSDYSQ